MNTQDEQKVSLSQYDRITEEISSFVLLIFIHPFLPLYSEGVTRLFCYFASNPEATRRYTLLTFASQVQFLEGIMLGEGRVRERRVPKTREGKRIRGSPGETTGRWQGSRGQSMRSSHYALERVALGKPLTPLCPRPSRVMSCGCWSVRVSAAT